MLNGVAEMASDARIQRRGRGRRPERGRLLGVTVLSWAFQDGEDLAGRR